jgi:hypothetical protein
MPWLQKLRNLDEVAKERVELARLLNKAGPCFLFKTVQGRYVPLRYVPVRSIHVRYVPVLYILALLRLHMFHP